MRLHDEILAARRQFNDIGGMLTSLGEAIMRAERFELTSEVARTGIELMRSKPSSLLKAMPLVRLPYDTMWLEWPGGLVGLEPADPENAPQPVRVGCLLQALDDTGQRAVMTWAWMHRESGVNMAPFGAVFDWRPEPETETIFDSELMARISPNRSHGKLLDGFLKLARFRFLNDNPITREEVARTARRWAKLSDHEIEAIARLIEHSRVWPSPHAAGMLQEVLEAANPGLGEMCLRWEKDIEGEGAFMEVILALLNSKNAVEHEHVDLIKLNRARGKAGKRSLLSYKTTRIRLTRSDVHRANAAGISRAEARGHKVRGHFKLRATGVFWWHRFERGDPDRPMPQRQYEVTP